MCLFLVKLNDWIVITFNWLIEIELLQCIIMQMELICQDNIWMECDKITNF